MSVLYLLSDSGSLYHLKMVIALNILKLTAHVIVITNVCTVSEQVVLGRVTGKHMTMTMSAFFICFERIPEHVRSEEKLVPLYASTPVSPSAHTVGGCNDVCHWEEFLYCV